ncbi:hypothetical protein J22TS3_08640 [Paenibacillus sp. J22TS3]|nr:hypothetical protein J22TS3_08640 [Paenibacillus sp. J22TS3]
METGAAVDRMPDVRGLPGWQDFDHAVNDGIGINGVLAVMQLDWP